MPDDYRPTEPVDVPDYAHKPFDDEPAPLPLPERSWKDSSLLWIGLVVLVFMAVPLLANYATRGTVRAQNPAASEPLAAAEPAAGDASAPATAAAAVTAPARTAPAPSAVAVDRPTPVPARVLVEPDRQTVTKCVERGRVVYTQTGECAGSVSAVPIDPGKNVVGPGRENTRP